MKTGNKIISKPTYRSRPMSASSLLVSKKHFQKNGKWIVKPSATVVLICVCGNKYIATRPNQTTCIKCIVMVK